MRSIIAIACLGLLLCIQPAMAQKEHTLTVSIHADLLPRVDADSSRKSLGGRVGAAEPTKKPMRRDIQTGGSNQTLRTRYAKENIQRG